MHKLGKWVLNLAVAVGLGLSFAPAASAGVYYPNNVDTLSTFLTGAKYKAVTPALSGSYYVTSLGYEAWDTIQFDRNSNKNSVLFTNQKTALETAAVKTGSWQQVAKIQNAKFYDVTTNLQTSVNNSEQVHVMKLLKDWKVNGMNLSAGTLIIGFNDKGSGDKDYDDFILAASKTKPSNTPIPGAVWLLGSGLAGLAGVRRVKRKA